MSDTLGILDLDTGSEVLVGPPVRASDEFRRIDALPRRTWTQADGAALSEAWSPNLLNGNGRRILAELARYTTESRNAALKAYAKRNQPLLMLPVQAVICHDFVRNKGCFVAAPVGAGKTLASWLIALLGELYFGVRCSVLMLPASLEHKTHRTFEAFRTVWQAPRYLQILTYESLGRVENEFRLCGCPKCCNEQHDYGGLRPQLVICDESDRLRSHDSAVSMRVGRYKARHPDTLYATMTGTVMRKSLRDFSRHLTWDLGFGAPIPLNYIETEEWCQALDMTPRDGKRRAPGALLHWGDETILDPIARAREGYSRRLAETPGVVVLDESSCDQPLTIRVVQVPDDPILHEAFARFRSTDETPDGWQLGDPLSVLRHGTELGCGFFYKWDPRPPEAWILARNAWNKFVRLAIDASKQGRGRPLDSEKAVAKRFPEAEELVAWRAIKDTFKPNSVAVPVTPSILNAAKAWLADNSPALVFVQHSWVGETLSRISGVPYFGAKGKWGATYIEDWPATHSAILSAHSNRRGRNLQAWHRGLVIGPEHSAERAEQQIGRMHRLGQEHPVVYDILVSCAENVQSIKAQILEASTAQEITLRQKILNATWEWQVAPYVLDKSHPDRPIIWVGRNER